MKPDATPAQRLAAVLTPDRLLSVGADARAALWAAIGRTSCRCPSVVAYRRLWGSEYSPPRVDRCRLLVGHPGPHRDSRWRVAPLVVMPPAPYDATTFDATVLAAMHGNPQACRALQWTVPQ